MPSNNSHLGAARVHHTCGDDLLYRLLGMRSVPTDSPAAGEHLQGRHRSFEPGATLFHVGTESHSLYLIHSGSFKTVALDDSGGEQVMGFHLPGELMGLGALGRGLHRCEAIALEPAEVCELPLAALEQVAREVPGVQHGLLRLLGQVVELDQDHLAILGRRAAVERLLLFVDGLSRRLQRLGRPANEVILPMRRDEIANYLGLVIETVSRGLGSLQSTGLIQVRGRRLRVPDPDRLRAAALGLASSRAEAELKLSAARNLTRAARGLE